MPYARQLKAARGVDIGCVSSNMTVPVRAGSGGQSSARARMDSDVASRGGAGCSRCVVRRLRTKLWTQSAQADHFPALNARPKMSQKSGAKPALKPLKQCGLVEYGDKAAGYPKALPKTAEIEAGGPSSSTNSGAANKIMSRDSLRGFDDVDSRSGGAL